VPENLLSFIIFVELEELQRDITFERTIQIPQLKQSINTNGMQ
jgi:hypothetical protein